MRIRTFREFHSPIRESEFKVNITYRNLVILNLLHQHHQISEEVILQRMVEFLACSLSSSIDEGEEIIFNDVVGEGSMRISLPVPVLSMLIADLDNNPDYQGKTASKQVSSILHNLLTSVGNRYFELRDLDLTRMQIFNNISTSLDGICGCNWI